MPTNHSIIAQDGLRLHVSSYGEPAAPALPVVCLPGLARTGADFESLATALANDAEAPRYVLAVDYRGRGRSDYDSNPQNYSVAVELSDVLAVLTALAIARAVFVGTSRGGILAMLLASARPTAVAGVVLNDIGPVIELRGIARIKSYVGKLAQPKSFEDGGKILRDLFGAQFTKLSPQDWTTFARRTFKDQNGRLVPCYDVKLAQTLEGIDLSQPLPPLWKEFDALADVPVMVIRGANSDVLSAATVDAMRARRPDIVMLEVPDQGHPPILAGDDVVGPIGAFVRGCERQRVGSARTETPAGDPPG
jgi:pimeloyl-ACP methyl ester carboxylesterase